ncbi:VOC family protein [Tropicibacter naphthalenivorans]|uniref:Glyoxalase-like domain-containing protein n=1 Tax=Tropicibacter naphthalenivorans TaxID=441103 RepID=A0A0P1G467_9RHOB|nr:VOC family protein [Tropicibacter naphthalenivorans]CUH76541.1 hypothetical protein TRN7648_00989 [Tropicibacter naphthalenivorans]SMC65479.1 Glyoxalase-like domain-containing protein [Tropicibacter naphthalenivorans]
MLVLDHIAVLGGTLAEATAHTEEQLGQPLNPGGVHGRFGTHNQLLELEPDLYIEAIAIDPSAPAPDDPRWFGLDAFAGPARLDKWVCRVDDLDAALQLLPMAGRRLELQRGDLRWAMAVPLDGMLPFDGLFPALIQWHTDVPPGKALPTSGLTLQSLTVTHPQADELASLLKPYLDAPLVRFETGLPGMAAEIAVDHGSVTLR